MSPAPDDIVSVVSCHEDRADLADAMKSIYDELDEAIASHKPTCWNHGDCCKFGSFGHRLYVTSVELSYFRRGHEPAWRIPKGDICPYQVGGKCTAREHRPLGCRVFFCDPNAQHWQGPLYERFLIRLKSLGERLGVEYRYLEWLSALRQWPETASGARTPGSVDPPRPGVIELSVLN